MNSDIIGINLLKFWRGLSAIHLIHPTATVSCTMRDSYFDFKIDLGYNVSNKLLPISILVNCSNAEQLGLDEVKIIMKEERYARRID